MPIGHRTVEKVTDTFKAKRAYLQSELTQALAPGIRQHLEDHVAERIGVLEQQVFSTTSRAEMAVAATILETLSTQARNLAGSAEDLATSAMVTLTPGPAGSKALRALLSNEGSRLDLSLGFPPDELVLVLRDAGIDVKIRLLLSVSAQRMPDLDPDLLSLLRSRSALTARNLQTQTGSEVPLAQEIILTSNEAWVPSRPLTELGRREIVLRPHPLGYRAAEREFASRWTGLVTGHKECLPTSIR